MESRTSDARLPARSELPNGRSLALLAEDIRVAHDLMHEI